jgi:hypothetical protein
MPTLLYSQIWPEIVSKSAELITVLCYWRGRMPLEKTRVRDRLPPRNRGKSSGQELEIVGILQTMNWIWEDISNIENLTIIGIYT